MRSEAVCLIGTKLFPRYLKPRNCSSQGTYIFQLQVFRCNIQNLSFNTSHRLDHVCQRAVSAVLEASSKFNRARHYLWFRHIIEGQLLARNKLTPKDWWPSKLDLPKYSTCLECIKCCGLNVQPKKDLAIKQPNEG